MKQQTVFTKVNTMMCMCMCCCPMQDSAYVNCKDEAVNCRARRLP